MGKHSAPDPALVEDAELPEDVVFDTLKRQMPGANDEDFVTVADNIVDDLIRNGWKIYRVNNNTPGDITMRSAPVDLSEFDKA